jgi:hypothetical protein
VETCGWVDECMMITITKSKIYIIHSNLSDSLEKANADLNLCHVRQAARHRNTLTQSLRNVRISAILVFMFYTAYFSLLSRAQMTSINAFPRENCA